MTENEGNGQAAEGQVAIVQATAEGVSMARTVEFMGKRFRIADKVGLMPLMKFAHAASLDERDISLDAYASIYEMLRDCIHPGNDIPDGQPGHDEGDWRKFEQHAIKTKADVDDLLPVVQRVIEVLTARPTARPGSSSDGQPPTSPISTGSSSPVPAAASNP